MRRALRRLSRALIFLAAGVLVLIGLLLAVVETSWGKNQLRALAVAQANKYLTARLEIGHLGGSLLRGLELGDIKLTRDGRTIIAIDEVEVHFSLRELLQEGRVIRSIRLTRPHVVAAREADGRWNLAALIKREVRERENTGPKRSLAIQSVEVIDGLVSLQDPLTFGDVHVPGRYERLNLSLAFAYEPVSWRLTINSASWLGGRTDLGVDRMTGSLGNGHDGWSFTDLRVQTAQSAFTVNGRVVTGHGPADLDLHVVADRFVFQEWGGVLPALRRIPIDSRFDVRLKGPVAALDTNLELHSNGGDAAGTVLLNTTEPGWHAAGALTLTTLNLANWFDDPERVSDISGHAQFDLALRLGRGVPQGHYVFDGSHAAYLGYAGDRVRARGDITDQEWRIAEGSVIAYKANVTIASGTIGLTKPIPFHFRGTASGVDLRALPDTIPVPHVESVLAFDFDATGQFSMPFLAAQTRFADSEFLGARLGAGGVGTIDTRQTPVAYSGEADLTGVNLHRFGDELKWLWLQEPKYAGTMGGHFLVQGAGSDSATMTLDVSGRLARANLFEGTLHDADVEAHIAAGSLTGAYDGSFTSINPAVALGDERFAATLTGKGSVRVAVDQLLVRSPLLDDYDINGSVALENSDAQGVHLDQGTLTGHFSHDRLDVTELHATGPLFDVAGSGTIGLADTEESRFDYDVKRGDLALFKESLGDVSAQITTQGHLAGPGRAIHLTGNATVDHLNADGVTAATTTGDYEVTFPWDNPAAAIAHVTGQASGLAAFNQQLKTATGTVDYADNRLNADLSLVRDDGLSGTVAGTVVLHPGEHALDIVSASGSLRGIGWRMLPADAPPTFRWDADGMAITPVTLVDAMNGDQRLAFSGTWRPAGGGTMHVTASHVFLDTLTGTTDTTPAMYGGVIDLDASVTGTNERPVVAGEIAVTEGRVLRVTYEKLAGHVNYVNGQVDIDLRLDQSPGVWLTAVGKLPTTLFSGDRTDEPLDLALASSDISLGLLEGLTDRVREVGGRARMDLRIAGTTRAPSITGPLDMSGVGFQLAATGARYKNGSTTLAFASDHVNVSAFHLEDRRGRGLEVTGSLGTQELRVGELEVNISAHGFEVLRNEVGSVDVDASLSLRGQFESPRLFGDIALTGGEIRVDELLDRILFAPYTPATTGAVSDAISALNPWNRLSVKVAVHSGGDLRMTGDNVHISQNAPLGLGSFNLRASGDVYLDKEPEQELSVTGSLDSIGGSYSFQGRRFDLYPSSAIDFRGDLNPGLFITANRVVSGIETRVTISGTLREPELQLSSTPPLEESDILSLIVFNSSTTDLAGSQQQELAARAGAIGLGFISSNLTQAIERSLNLDILEIEPGVATDSGTKLTIGEEIAPRLLARYTRQFGGLNQYDVAAIEYRILRMLRIVASYSPHASDVVTSAFRRVETYGIDLLFSFSF